MCADSGRRKSSSPQASPENSSLQVNRMKNKEALEKGLRCRRSVKELVNQGILLSPSISHSDTVRKLQRAKTSDQLKHKIERRPDRQYLINRRIIRDDKPGTSPFILEQCHNLEKYQLKNSLNLKLIKRPGSLELVEKGVLQVDPGIDTLIRGGSISYPRVETPRSRLSPVDQINSTVVNDTDNEFGIPTPPTLSFNPVTSAATSSSCRQRTLSTSRTSAGGASSINGTGSSRSMRDETVVYKMGPYVFHNYCPKSSSGSGAAASSSSTPVPNLFQKAREAQQAEMLRLQDTAKAHWLLEQELCQRIGSDVLKSVDHEEDGNQCGDSPFSACSLLSTSTHSSGVTSGGGGGGGSSCSSGPLSAIMVTSPDMEGMSDLATSPSVRLLTPRRQPGSDAPSSQRSPLERLTTNQLRAECRQRGLSRSGLKACLVRQLEPYRNELVAKYQLPISETGHLATDYPTGAAFRAKLASTEADVAFPVPVSFPLGLHTESRSAGVTSSHLAPSSTSVTDNTVYLYPSLPDVMCPAVGCTRVVNSSDICSGKYVDSVGNPVVLHSTTAPDPCPCGPGALRHSASEPQFATVHNPHIVGATLASVQLTAGVSNLFFRPVATVQSGGSVSNVWFTPSSTSTSSLTAVTPSVVLANRVPAHTTAVSETPPGRQLCHHSSLCSNPVGDHRTLSSHVITTAETPLIYRATSTCASNAVAASNNLYGNTSDHRAVGERQVSPTGQSSTLNQIEAYWLRIRQLRRSLAKLTTGTPSGDSSMETTASGQCTDLRQIPGGCGGGGVAGGDRAFQLKQEHERLCVLCRLLVIDRLDALDELVAGHQVGANNGADGQCLLTSSDLHVERTLLDAYLRKLGGTSILQPMDSSNNYSANPHHHPTLSSNLTTSVPVWPSVVTSQPIPDQSTPCRRASDLPQRHVRSDENSSHFSVNQQQQLLDHHHRQQKQQQPVVERPADDQSSPPTTLSVFALPGWSSHGLAISPPPQPAPTAEANDQSSRAAVPAIVFSGNGPTACHREELRRDVYATFQLPTKDTSPADDAYLSPEATDMLFSLWDGSATCLGEEEERCVSRDGGMANPVTGVLNGVDAALGPQPGSAVSRFSGTSVTFVRGIRTPPPFEVDMDTHDTAQQPYQHYRRGEDAGGLQTPGLSLNPDGQVASSATSATLHGNPVGSAISNPWSGHRLHFFTATSAAKVGNTSTTTSSMYNCCKNGGGGDVGRQFNDQLHFMDSHCQVNSGNQHTRWPVAAGYSQAVAGRSCTSPMMVRPGGLLDSSSSSQQLDLSGETDSFFNSLDVSDFAELMDTIEAGVGTAPLTSSTAAASAASSTVLLPSSVAPIPVSAFVAP